MRFSRRSVLQGGALIAVTFGLSTLAPSLSGTAHAELVDSLALAVLPSDGVGDTAGAAACAVESAKDYFLVRLGVPKIAQRSVVLSTPAWFLPPDGTAGSVVNEGWRIARFGASDVGQTWELKSTANGNSKPAELRLKLAQGLVPQSAGTISKKIAAEAQGSSPATAAMTLERATEGAPSVESVTCRNVITKRPVPCTIVVTNDAAAPVTALSICVELGSDLELELLRDEHQQEFWTLGALGGGRYSLSATAANTVLAYERRALKLQVKSSRAHRVKDPVPRRIVAYINPGDYVDSGGPTAPAGANVTIH